jgi:hypothetical protein
MLAADQHTGNHYAVEIGGAYIMAGQTIRQFSADLLIIGMQHRQRRTNRIKKSVLPRIHAASLTH